jgi:hypothetical protein
MLLYYTKGYHNAFVRFLHSFFIQMPLTIWFRFISVLFFWQRATFVNFSGLSDQQLADIWKQVQQTTATQPIQQGTGAGATWPADPRALTLQPKNLAVVAVPDWKITDLEKIDPAWSKDKDPSGSFAIMNNGLLGYETVAGVTETWNKPRIYGAASVMATVLQWEFQNVILNKLGYNVEGR